ncbi:hypothetical protein [Arthrobacter agilis]|uniref:hypothetical protein n=1 Tax=Arthrobacter agilis TaxID=37921 RepID=UPI0027849791|nr:hypothetical protein [Arthrobacter agilis]MDQ0735296.1 hypothetical protein [Arthrobacter agilis]
MSAKQEATYHGADIVTRLRLYGPESDYDGVMSEAANEIEELRAKLAWVSTDDGVSAVQEELAAWEILEYAPADEIRAAASAAMKALIDANPHGRFADV